MRTYGLLSPVYITCTPVSAGKYHGVAGRVQLRARSGLHVVPRSVLPCPPVQVPAAEGGVAVEDPTRGVEMEGVRVQATQAEGSTRVAEAPGVVLSETSGRAQT